MEKNQIIIKDVAKDSIAFEAGIEAKDILLSVDNTIVNDIIEYKFLTCEENLTLQIKKQNGEEWDIDIEKDYYEDLGIIFDEPIIDTPKSCHNKCMFCFIDQLPKGLRDTLYFKDDDSRLSFLQGNFITLTNMKDDDIKRIIRYRISPINISVHTTNPELRTKMLNNKNAGKLMSYLQELANADINVNCQIVLCPKINDGLELEKTLSDLSELYPSVSNVAIVPVGITKFRGGLYELESYDKASALEVIKLVTDIQESFITKIGTPFARLADEFYIQAEAELPDASHYEDFEQLEDGIGMLKYLEMCVREALEMATFDAKGQEVAFITGVSSFNFINAIAKKIDAKLNTKIKVYKISNATFGEKITVTGLLTGKDILEQTKDFLTEELVFIPTNMLKADEDIFLDDTTLAEFTKGLNKTVIKCKYTGEDLVEKIINEVIKWQNR